MPEERIPVGAQFLGVQKRVAPHLLQPTHSPDCQNCRPYSGLIGRLGPRKGRTKLSSTAYAARVRGFWPGSGGGGDSGDDYSLVAIDDGSSVTILSESAIWSGGGAWGGPAASTFNGFYVRWTDPTNGPAESCVDTQVFTELVNGALWAIATLPSCTGIVSEVTLQTLLKFDADDYVVANTGILSSCGCCGGMSLTVNPTPVNCTGKTRLTGIKCTATEIGNTALELSGEVYAQGSAAALVTEGGP